MISFPEERMTAFFDALVSLHEQVFDSADSDKAVDQKEATAATGPNLDDEPWIASHEAADSGFLDDEDLQNELNARAQKAEESVDRRQWRVESLSSGAWVDLALAGNWVRAQLTWTSPQRTLFLFISNGGMTHSMSRNTIEKMKK